MTELLLVKEGGYSLEDIQGREAERTYTRPPTLMETVEAADFGPASWPAFVATVCLALAGAGALTMLVGTALVWLALAAVQVKRADAGPRVEREKVSSPGMNESEVWRRVIALDELVEMRNDKMEKEQRKSRRQQGDLPGV